MLPSQETSRWMRQIQFGSTSPRVVVPLSGQTINNTRIKPQDFRDQMAIQVPVQDSEALPFQCMGQSGRTVNIWRGNAEWPKRPWRGSSRHVGRGSTIPAQSPGTTTMRSPHGAFHIRIEPDEAPSPLMKVSDLETSCQTLQSGSVQ